MKFKIILLISILLVCFAGCSRVPDELKIAEKLINTAPDSSFHILQKLQSNKIQGRYNRALYALLMSQALNKRDSVVDNDSLITVATDYFDDSDPVHAGYAWFYHARTAFYRDSVNEEAKNLLKAQEFAEIAGDTKLLGLIYGDKANMYISQGQVDSAICYSKKAFFSFNQINDNRNSIIALLSIATEFVKKNQIDSTKYYYSVAENLAKKIDDKIIISYIYRNIGITYFQQGNYRLALQNFRKAPVTNIKIYDSNQYYLIGSLYVKINQPDSAIYYLKKVSELGAMASDYYRLWQKISLFKGDINRALYYANKVSFATDSLYKRKLEISFAGLEQKYKYQGLQIDKQRLIIINKQRGLYLLVTILILSVFITLFLFWRLKAKKQEVEYQKDIANKNQDIANKNQDIANKNQELLEKEQEKVAKERENNALLERQLRLQNILLSNIKMHQTNTVKRPAVWREGSKETIEKQYVTFYNELKTYVDMEFNNFTTRLKEKHPSLTENDMFISCLLLADFETGMIATVLNVQTASIIKQRYRLRSKLKLEKLENLVDYLLHF